MPPGPI